jgi:hypothetical protein
MGRARIGVHPARCSAPRMSTPLAPECPNPRSPFQAVIRFGRQTFQPTAGTLFPKVLRWRPTFQMTSFGDTGAALANDACGATRVLTPGGGLCYSLRIVRRMAAS